MNYSPIWISKENIKVLIVQDRVYLKKLCNIIPVNSFNLDNMQVCETLKKITILQKENTSLKWPNT